MKRGHLGVVGVGVAPMDQVDFIPLHDQGDPQGKISCAVKPPGLV